MKTVSFCIYRSFFDAVVCLSVKQTAFLDKFHSKFAVLILFNYFH